MSLKYTLDQVRTRELAHLKTLGLPTAWWSLPAGNDCIAFQLWNLGVRTNPKDFSDHFISIKAFRAWAKWPEVKMSEAQPGDLALEEWPDEGDPFTGIPGHIEYIYSIDHEAKTITTISANTGPEPGKPRPRGVYKKTRPLDEHFLGAIQPPYLGEKVSTARATEVRDVAVYLNSLDLGKTTYAAVDGQEGPIYWWLIQTWGRENSVYPKPYVIDGVPGPKTRSVEAIIFKLAKKG